MKLTKKNLIESGLLKNSINPGLAADLITEVVTTYHNKNKRLEKWSDNVVPVFNKATERAFNNKLIKSCSNTAIQDCYHPSFNVVMLLNFFEQLIETCGIEYLEKEQIEYCNTGDSYALTICYNRKTRRFTINSWSDFVKGA